MTEKLKLLVIGYAGHGKDTVCELIEEIYGYTFVSSSFFCADKVVRPELVKQGVVYGSLLECYEDRKNHRSVWFEAIKRYNSEDNSRLGREITSEYDIYCGMRNHLELEACSDAEIFDHIIWVDSSERLPDEPASSCTVDRTMCDITLDNNGDEIQLRENVIEMMNMMTVAETECIR